MQGRSGGGATYAARAQPTHAFNFKWLTVVTVAAGTKAHLSLPIPCGRTYQALEGVSHTHCNQRCPLLRKVQVGYDPMGRKKTSMPGSIQGGGAWPCMAGESTPAMDSDGLLANREFSYLSEHRSAWSCMAGGKPPAMDDNGQRDASAL